MTHNFAIKVYLICREVHTNFLHYDQNLFALFFHGKISCFIYLEIVVTYLFSEILTFLVKIAV